MKIVIFGSSGHGSDVADVAVDNGYTDIIFLTKDTNINNFCGFPVKLDTSEIVQKLAEEGYDFAIGVGANSIRKSISIKYPNINYPTLIHSSATAGNCLPPDCNSTRGTIIAAGNRITNNVTIGDFCFLGVNSVIGHDCIIDDYVSLMPGACISGNVHIFEGAYIGCNAAIKQGLPNEKLSIGQNSTIGMGATILHSVKDNLTVVGNSEIRTIWQFLVTY